MTNLTDVSTEIIVFSSGKGGTGKTSLIAALGYALSYSGHRVLMIDADRATDGLSLFILGPYGMNQLADYKPQNTFSGILEQFERSRQIDAEPRIVHRSGPNDHDLSYQAIISGKGLYGDPSSPTDNAPIESWNRQFDRATFQKGVQELFQMLRVQQYDYILVDSRGGFAFESTDVAAAADSFVIVTEATNTNFYQDRNLVDRINAAAEQMKTRPLLRGIIVNKATEPPEISYRQELVREFKVRLEDTFPVALDLGAAAVYKTQKVIYREAPASQFAHDSLQAFKQILKVVTSQWPEERARRWNELVTNVDASIAKHNAEVEAVKRHEQERITHLHALETERATLKAEMARLQDAHEQEKRRQEILFEELRAQARQRDEAAERERARDQVRLRDEKENQAREIERLALQLRDRERDFVDARDRVRSLELGLIESERAVVKAQFEGKQQVVEFHAKRRLYAAFFSFLGILVIIAGYIWSYRINTTGEMDKLLRDVEMREREISLAEINARKNAALYDQIRDLQTATAVQIAEMRGFNPVVARLVNDPTQLAEVNKILKAIGAPKSDFTVFGDAAAALNKAFRNAKAVDVEKWRSALGILVP